MDIDLIMSGSGTRFGAHIGAYSALNDLKMRPKRIVGTSGGAIVGSFIAAGFNANELTNIFMELNLDKTRKLRPWKLFSSGGIYDNKPLYYILKAFLGKITFKDLDFDITLCGYDLRKKCLYLMNKKNTPDLRLADAAVISSTIPFYFGYKKIKINQEVKYLTDGAMAKNYPVDVLQNEGRKTIGLLIGSNNAGSPKKHFNFGEYVKSVIGAWYVALTKEHIEDAHWAHTITIPVEGLSPVNFNLSLESKHYLLQTGYSAVMRWHRDG
jgi:NTE family protein